MMGGLSKSRFITLYFAHTKPMSARFKSIFKKVVIVFLILFIVAGVLGFMVIEPRFKIFGLKNLDSAIMENSAAITVMDRDDKALDFRNTMHVDADISDIPQHTIDAFVSIEDNRFFSHHGYDPLRIAKAAFKNITSFKYKEGASTITQQLVKNTQLSPEKKLSRKINEIRIAREIERKYEKEKILERYLNVIYFGKNIYGISNASYAFFNKNVSELDIPESALLAGIINNPSLYNPHLNLEKSLNRRNLVLKQMLKYEKITQTQYDEAINTQINLTPPDTYLDTLSKMIMHELSANVDENTNTKSNRDNNSKINEIKLNNNFEIHDVENNNDTRIFTQIDENFTKQAHKIICEQKEIFSEKTKEIVVKKNAVVEQKSLSDTQSHDLEIAYILIDNTTNNIISASSTHGINMYTTPRQAGSTLKPIVVYAPALECNLITPLSPILDCKTDFGGGFCPKNYDNKYHGWTTVEDCLSKSLNIPAVKVLQGTGVAPSLEVAKKMGINFDESDQNLSLALGSMYKGIDLPSLTNAYTTFANMGKYNKASIIAKKDISDKQNNIIPKYHFEKETKNTLDNIVDIKNYIVTSNNLDINNSTIIPSTTQAIRPDTAELINDMLVRTVSHGTAHALDDTQYMVAAKTGTVGNKDYHTDAYCIAYTSTHTIGVWAGGKMPTTIKGGTLPTAIVKQLLDTLYKDTLPPDLDTSDDMEYYNIDNEVLEKDHKVQVAPKYRYNNSLYNQNLYKFSKHNTPSPMPLMHLDHNLVLEYYVENTNSRVGTK